MKKPKSNKKPDGAESSACRPSVPDHEILRLIGEGAYGEVWLARSIMGNYRAVKVVHRKRFKDDRPYEREFNGIQKYEPFSRAESGLLNILQIGRNNENKYFYYVMELADDGSLCVEKLSEMKRSDIGSTESSLTRQKIDVEKYVPRTLSQVLSDKTRLNAADCLSLALSLTHSIGFLHENHLLHRDIKPSNIIFIRGVPKLADIGLLADASEARSLVGTEGYIAPEGPNSPQGDIFSLGKVLYEASTGKDRHSFPEPISNIHELPDPDKFLELNAVTVKACQHDFKHRYTSMYAMRADLELIQEGKSVKRRRMLEQRFSFAWRAAVAILGVALVGYFLRVDSPRNLGPTMTRLQIDNASYWLTAFTPRNFDVSPDGTQIVIADQDTSGLSMWDTATKIKQKFDLPEANNWRFTSPRWSSDGKLIAFIARRYEPANSDDPVTLNRLFVLDPASSELTRIGEEWEGFDGQSRVCWGPGSEGLILVLNHQAYRVALDGGMTLWSNFNVPRLGHLGGYSSDGKWLVFDAIDSDSNNNDERDLWVMPSEGGMARQLTHGSGLDGFPAWAPDGYTLCYVSADDSRDNSSWNLWRLHIDTKTGNRIGDAEQLTFAKNQRIFHPKFVDHGDRIVFVTDRHQTTIWVGEDGGYANGKAAFRGRSPIPSSAGDTIYFCGTGAEQMGIFAYSRHSKTVRQITDLVPLGLSFSEPVYDLSHDDEALVFLSDSDQGRGIFTVSTQDGATTLIREVDISESTVPRWSPDAQRIAYGEFEGLFVVDREVGTPQKLAHIYRWISVDWSPDGKHLGGMGYASREEFEKGDAGTNAVFLYTFAEETFRRLTPPEEEYKEGAVWHPDSERISYMYYGPEEFGSEIRFAYLDGRATTLMIDQEDHWDYLGRWTRDGRRFYFQSNNHDGNNIHVFHLDSEEIEHGLWGGGLPTWSRDDKTMTWSTGESVREFVWLEDFQ